MNIMGYIPTVSIIIATFNAESSIKKALDSVLNQSIKNWECVVVDGLSKDSTCDIANSYAKKDIRFKVKREDDNGVYDAFNKGWRMAQGEWIYYLGADDELLPDGLEALLKYAEGVDLVYGGIRRKYRSGRTKDSQPSYWEKELPFSLPASHQAIIMKRNFIERLGGFNLNYHILADYDLMVHAYSEGIGVNRCNAIIAVFSLGGMSTDSFKSLPERYRVLVSYGVSKIKAFIHILRVAVFFSVLKIKHRFD